MNEHEMNAYALTRSLNHAYVFCVSVSDITAAAAAIPATAIATTVGVACCCGAAGAADCTHPPLLLLRLLLCMSYLYCRLSSLTGGDGRAHAARIAPVAAAWLLFQCAAAILAARDVHSSAARHLVVQGEGGGEEGDRMGWTEAVRM